MRLAFEPTKGATVGVQEAAKRRAMSFPAHGAVTVVDELHRATQFEANRAAKAGTADPWLVVVDDVRSPQLFLELQFRR